MKKRLGKGFGLKAVRLLRMLSRRLSKDEKTNRHVFVDSWKTVKFTFHGSLDNEDDCFILKT